MRHHRPQLLLPTRVQSIFSAVANSLLIPNVRRVCAPPALAYAGRWLAAIDVPFDTPGGGVGDVETESQHGAIHH